MNKEFNTHDMLPEICALLDGLNCTYKVHRCGDEGFAYLDFNSACVTVSAPDPDRTIFIDSECGLFFYFDGDDCESISESDFGSFSDTLTAVLKNEVCLAYVYAGEKKNLLSSGLRSKADIEKKSVAELFSVPPFVEFYRDGLEKDGAEVRFLFWDSRLDKTVIIEKKS